MSISAETQRRLKRDNPRQLRGKKYKKLHDDLKTFGDLSGVVYNVTTGQTIGGNQRSAVFDIGECRFEFTHENTEPDEQGTLKLGYVIWRGNRYGYREVAWPKEREDAACLIANIGAGEWDWERLAAFDSDILNVAGMDADMLATLERDEKALRMMLEAGEAEAGEADAEPQIDRAAELNEKWQVKTGDLWQIGEHRLLCGDSTRREDVERVMGGEKALVFADAPYGVGVVKNNKVGADFGVAKKGIYSPIEGDETTDTAEKFYNLCTEIGLDKFILWGGNYFTKFLPFSTGWIVWDKRGDSGIKNTFADGEMAWTNVTAQVRIYTQLWNGMIREGEHEKRVHPTQKPVRVTSDIMRDFPSDIYFDGFAGSGTTLIACQNLSRQCRAIEISPNYCAVILERMSQAFPALAIHRIEA